MCPDRLGPEIGWRTDLSKDAVQFMRVGPAWLVEEAEGRVADRSSAMRHSILLRVVSVRHSRREHDGDRSRDRDTTRRALAHRYRFALNVTWSAYSADQVAGVSAGGYRYYPRDASFLKEPRKGYARQKHG
jgi:hypothetical protein